MNWFRNNHTLRYTYRAARRIAIGIIGATIALLGVVMLLTPGPGVLFILGGLAVLGMEFAWARLWLRKLKRTMRNNLPGN